MLRLVLSRLDPERAHALAVLAMRALRPLLPLVRRLCRPDPILRVQALGLELGSPLGAAAGSDKSGTWFEGQCSLGFGFAEVGTVTARAQEGNPRPRVFRLVEDRALINRLGFPNDGASAVARRVGRRRSVVGVNVGKSRDVSLEAAGADYRDAVRRVGSSADYVVVNVSSPNTPGLRGIQAERSGLSSLVGSVLAELGPPPRLPVLLKIGPDLDDAEIDAIADLAVELGVDGIVAVNTTVTRPRLASSDADLEGGLSGPPLRPRALEVLRRLRARVGERLVLISVGGIETPEDAWERIQAGASLVQAYTAFVYNGPGWPSRMNRGLARLVRESGYESLEEAIGAKARRTAPWPSPRPDPVV